MTVLLTLARRLLDIAVAAILVCALLAAVVSVVGPTIGYSLVVLRGNSMAPTAPVGSLLLVQAVPADALAAGDVVTFTAPGGTVTTHRIVRVIDREDGPYLETKGDNSATADPRPFPASLVLGRAVGWVAGAGFIVSVRLEPVLGLTAAGVLVALWMLGICLDELLRRGHRRELAVTTATGA